MDGEAKANISPFDTLLLIMGFNNTQIKEYTLKKQKKENRGGANRGQGRHNKYGEPTKTFSCRVPVSKKSELAAIVAAALKRWLK